MNRKIMLKNLTRLHTPELLHTLASIGHGDDLAIVDAHFLAVSMAQRPGESKHALFTKIERHALTRGQKRHPRSSQRENCGRMAAFLIKKAVVLSRWRKTTYYGETENNRAGSVRD
jgi:hypothetical protein